MQDEETYNSYIQQIRNILNGDLRSAQAVLPGAMMRRRAGACSTSWPTSSR